MSRTDACGPQGGIDQRELQISQQCKLMTRMPMFLPDHGNRFLASNPSLQIQLVSFSLRPEL